MTSPLPDPLPVAPFARPIRGGVKLPGSKSITNRALLLAALSNRRAIKLSGALFSDDTRLMAAALERLGFTIQSHADHGEIVVDGRGGKIPATEAELFVGLAGTAARFLTALCALSGNGTYRLDGVPQMRKRPMKPLLDALRSLGADIRCLGEEGFLPIEIRGRGLDGGTVELDASESSQLLSALLMVAPFARQDVRVKLRGSVRREYVEMSTNMMRAFAPDHGSLVTEIAADEFLVRATPPPYAIGSSGYAIEPDASAASYFLALPLVTGGSLSLQGARDPRSGFQLQADTKFVDVVRQIGAAVTANGQGLEVAFQGAPRRAITRNFHDISDTFLTLAAIAPLLDGPTTITGIAHTRKQETDRVAGAARELARLGQDVHEHPDGDGLTIAPRPLKAGVAVETYGDHRFAMSFGILGCHPLHGPEPWLSIRNPACCAKTFPDFFQLLEALREGSLGDGSAQRS